MTQHDDASHKALLDTVTRSLASQSLSAERMVSITDALSDARYPVIDWECFPHGIKVGHQFSGETPKLDFSDFTDDRLGRILKMEYFPYGIVRPEGGRVVVTHQLYGG